MFILYSSTFYYVTNGKIVQEVCRNYEKKRTSLINFGIFCVYYSPNNIKVRMMFVSECEDAKVVEKNKPHIAM